MLAGSCLTAVLAASGSARAGQFTDVTSDAGLDYVHHVPREPPDCVGGIFCETERMSGGVAVADIDGDHLLDLFVTRTDAPDILWRNRGDGTFEDVTVAAGLGAFTLQSNGAGFGDIDNDGDPDLYVTVMDNSGVAPNNRNYLFVNDGSGVFTEEAVARGVDLTSARRRRSYSVAVGDFDRDGWLDLHTTEWLPSSKPHASLFRNLGAAAPGHFEDVTEAAGVGLVDSASFGSSMTDLDNDGWPDLAVVADFGTSRLFWNQGNGTFVEGTAAANVATDENGMGSTFGDFDGDGLLDWFVTSIFDADETCASLVDCNWGHSGNRLYRNEGGRVFSDATDAAGVRIGFWGWGAAFFDFDNDADLDLVMTNGVNFPITDKETSFHADPMRLWVKDGSGVFSEESAARGVTDTGSGKA